MARFEIITGGTSRGRFEEAEVRDVAETGRFEPDAVVRDLETGTTSPLRDWQPREPSPSPAPEDALKHPYGYVPEKAERGDYLHSGRMWGYIAVVSMFVCLPVAIITGILAIRRSGGDFRARWLGITAVVFSAIGALYVILAETLEVGPSPI